MTLAEVTPGHPPRTTPQEAPRSKPELLSVDFNERPFTVAWELTRSCALACVHCRAEAQPQRHPDELTTVEELRLDGVLVELAPPVLVLTAGDTP
ncbi:MAG: hypothetical protein EXR66_01095 [Dehalococcoidia bacterium]|nr:hypothetical protein [Dehalococcoidia bacterium]